MELLGRFIVHARGNAVKELDHFHFRAKAFPHRSHLQPDHPAADDDQLLRDFKERQRADCYNPFFVDGHARRRHDGGASGDQDVFRLVFLAVHADFVFAGMKRQRAFQPFDSSF